ncbi:nuclear transport factor 2 family protein [Actinomadura miaoliensis]|uniref:SnoaL-like domain-containing protein n=1 Tax=Actinomadura miaoliensis TaxID=430685 RepID=A0ABP7X7M1_9ACTN
MTGRRITAAAFALVTTLTLAGCGGDEDPSAAAPTTSAGASSAGRPPASAPASVDGVDAAARAYVDAVNRRDLDALVNAFAGDGAVVDVSRTISGRDAIRAWARDEVIGGSLRVLSIAERRDDGQKLLVHWAPSGSQGWRAHYDFTVSGGKIRTADLQYA